MRLDYLQSGAFLFNLLQRILRPLIGICSFILFYLSAQAQFVSTDTLVTDPGSTAY